MQKFNLMEIKIQLEKFVSEIVEMSFLYLNIQRNLSNFFSNKFKKLDDVKILLVNFSYFSIRTSELTKWLNDIENFQ